MKKFYYLIQSKMKIYVIHLTRILALALLLLSCEKLKDISCSLEVPENLTCGNGGGSICAVYHYGGGLSLGATVYLNWDDVSGAEGYILYVKQSNGEYAVIDSTDTSRISVGQGNARSVTYVVKAYTEKCESDFSEEYKFTTY
jgi:hypothetical protein